MSSGSMTWEEAVNWLRGQPDQQELVKACFYDDPLLEAAERYFRSSEWMAISEYLPKGQHASLDIGAGRGIASYALAKQGFNVTALEPNESSLVGAEAIKGLAKEASLDIRVEQNWGETLPFPDACFDVVHARQVLHHARSLSALCMEAARVLKPGGVFIATREHVISRDADLDEFYRTHALHKYYGGEKAYRLDEYIQAIEQAGIKLKKVLNPFASDINLYPETQTQLKKRIAEKLKLAPSIIPTWVLPVLGSLNRTPGRLYSFIGNKA